MYSGNILVHRHQAENQSVKKSATSKNTRITMR